MSDAELLAEARALDEAEDKAALSDPASLLGRLVPKYRIRPHLQIISTQMHRVMLGEIDRLLITVPPQTGKTLTAVIGGAVWWLANRPADRIVIGSYGDSLAVERGRDSKKIITEHGHRFGLHLERGSGSVSDWRVTTGGGVLSVGIGAGVTGKAGDIAFIDDPHKSRAEADSKIFRDRAYRWLSADIISRLSPGAPLVLIMTPWHPDDLAARVTADEGTTDKGGRWEVIRMPAFCDDPEHDPLHRKYGDPLPHPKIAVCDTARLIAHWNDKRSGSTLQDWFALYMCNPQPAEGALLSQDLMRERRCYTTAGRCDTAPTRAAVAIDPSGGGRDTAGIIGGYLGSDRRLYISRDESGVMSSGEWSRKACELAVDIDADLIIFEKNYGGDMGGRVIKTAWQSLQTEEREAARQALIGEHPTWTARQIDLAADRVHGRFTRICPRIKAVTARMNKRLRADPIAQQWTEDRIRTAAYLPDLEREWTTWQMDSTDSPGRIDASTYLAYSLLPIPKAGSGGAAAPGGSLPTTSASPLARGSGGSGFGPLGR